uniref:Beta-fructofuranosidase 1-like n=1 Tax=Elaeis guineensis var. tenera TaxID=51953 RepID=A0A6I9QL18_ELAGV
NLVENKKCDELLDVFPAGFQQGLIPTNYPFTQANWNCLCPKSIIPHNQVFSTVSILTLQTIPRTVTYDDKTGRNLLQWPVDEVERLRQSSQEFSNITLGVGSVAPLDISKATQLDIEAKFEIDASALERAIEADVGYNCSTSGGAAGRGALGPFGLLVLADQDLSEQTAVYFYLGRGTDGGLGTFFCQDELRSSLANDLVKRVYGSSVPVLDGESLTVRILVSWNTW